MHKAITEERRIPNLWGQECALLPCPTCVQLARGQPYRNVVNETLQDLDGDRAFALNMSNRRDHASAAMGENHPMLLLFPSRPLKDSPSPCWYLRKRDLSTDQSILDNPSAAPWRRVSEDEARKPTYTEVRVDRRDSSGFKMLQGEDERRKPCLYTFALEDDSPDTLAEELCRLGLSADEFASIRCDL